MQKRLAHRLPILYKNHIGALYQGHLSGAVPKFQNCRGIVHCIYHNCYLSHRISQQTVVACSLIQRVICHRCCTMNLIHGNTCVHPDIVYQCNLHWRHHTLHHLLLCHTPLKHLTLEIFCLDLQIRHVHLHLVPAYALPSHSIQNILCCKHRTHKHCSQYMFVYVYEDCSIVKI